MNTSRTLSALALLFFCMTASAQKKEIKTGETLRQGTGVFSQNGKWVLIMENSVPSGRYGMFSTFATNNFSLARDKGIMSSNPNTNLGKSTSKAQKLILQNDGNLVAYDEQNGSYIWDSKTAGQNDKAAKMIVENDGTVSLYNTANQKLWNTKSGLSKPAPTPAPTASVAPNNVYNKIMTMKGKYPQGMNWTDNNFDRPGGNTGCYAFSMILMNAAFGDKRTERRYTNFNEIRVGDMVRVNKDTHSMIVIGKDNNQFTFAEGNYGGKINWGRTMTIAELKNSFNYGLTSYP